MGLTITASYRDIKYTSLLNRRHQSHDGFGILRLPSPLSTVRGKGVENSVVIVIFHVRRGAYTIKPLPDFPGYNRDPKPNPPHQPPTPSSSLEGPANTRESAIVVLFWAGGVVEYRVTSEEIFIRGDYQEVEE